jgi:hypothetical protein
VKPNAAAATLFAVVITLLGPPSRADALAPGFDSSYTGESAFISISPGQPGEFQVFFMNTGETTWRKGTATQVNLTICLDNKVSCNLPSPHSDWNNGSWLSERAYATHTQSAVVPGTVAQFTYRIRAPITSPSGTYRFSGDLALATGQQLHPDGYYQEAVIPRP